MFHLMIKYLIFDQNNTKVHYTQMSTKRGMFGITKYVGEKYDKGI